MTDRSTYSGSSTEVPWKDEGSTEGFGNQYDRHIGNLYRYSVLPLTSVSGSDTITASVEPELGSGGLMSGMKFTLAWAEANTGAVTLNIGGTGDIAVLTADGDALNGGELSAGSRAMLEYDGSDFRMIGGASGGSLGVNRQVFLSSGTWIKPSGYGDNSIVKVRLWGAGAGGGEAGSVHGGGGGAYCETEYVLSDLASSVAVVIGAGGVSMSNGGSSTFYTAVAPGGEKTDGTNGGEGGDQYGSPLWSGADGGATSDDGSDAAFGGGGGGAIGASGGASMFGGAGGGGGAISTGGSTTAGTSGETPGGGGGFLASGGNGKAIIEVWE